MKYKFRRIPTACHPQGLRFNDELRIVFVLNNYLHRRHQGFGCNWNKSWYDDDND